MKYFSYRVVEFRTYKIMKKAIEKFDGTEFFDRKIKIIDVSGFNS